VSSIPCIAPGSAETGSPEKDSVVVTSMPLGFSANRYSSDAREAISGPTP